MKNYPKQKFDKQYTYKTADDIHLGAVREVDDRLAKFIANYVRGNESTNLPIKNFLGSKGVDESLLESILSKVENTFVGVYGKTGTNQYDDSGQIKKRLGQFQKFRPDFNPGVAPRDSIFISDQLSGRNILEVLMHEFFGHQEDITHSNEDYNADRDIYKKLEDESTIGMNVGTRSNILKYLKPAFSPGYDTDLLMDSKKNK